MLARAQEASLRTEVYNIITDITIYICEFYRDFKLVPSFPAVGIAYEFQKNNVAITI